MSGEISTLIDEIHHSLRACVVGRHRRSQYLQWPGDGHDCVRALANAEAIRPRAESVRQAAGPIANTAGREATWL